jgi:tetratricopeptide (TPR) repeat protein
MLDLSQKLPPLTAEEIYAAFLNSLRFREGFGIIFLECSPGEANHLIPQVKQDLPEKNIEVLDLVEPINNLYKLVEGRPDRITLNILFVRGLEKSLEADIKPGYKGLGDYYNLNTIPPILSHLNQQRENFRDHFGNICFVFLLPKFAIRYFVRRAPDFYDWNSGVFSIAGSLRIFSKEFRPEENQHSEELIIIEQHRRKLSNAPYGSLDNINQLQQLFTVGNDLYKTSKYEEAVSVYNDLLASDSSCYEAWVNRAACLDYLGRYEAAIDSYDNALKINSNDSFCWSNRGVTLDNLGRHQEALISYEIALMIKLDNPKALYNRGIALREAGNYKGAISSYDQALLINPKWYEAWNNRGNAFFHAGEYNEAIGSYCKALKINHNGYLAYHNKGLALFVIGLYSDSLANLQKAFEIIRTTDFQLVNDVSALIQEFIEELIPRFTQPPIQQTLLIPLLESYKESNVITELGAALVNTLHLIVAPAISDHTANQWLALWRTSSLGNEPAMELPLRLMSTAIEYKKDPSKRQRLWLNLPSEERPILDKALKIQ